MKKIVFAILVMSALQVAGQSNDNLKTHYEAYYKQMRLQGDVRGAISALTHLTVLEPSQARKDTLAYLYASANQYMQAINVLGAETNASDSDMALQIKAASLKSLSQPKLAAENYKLLFDRNPDVYTAYELADLSMQLGNLVDTKTYLDYGINNAKDTDKQPYYEANPPYEVPLKAAFLYLRGLYKYNLNKADIDTAVASIDEAIALAPNFNLAIQIKEALLKQKTEKE